MVQAENSQVIELVGEHIQEVMDLIRNVIKKMVSLGIDQWDEVYPSQVDIEIDIKRGNAIGLIEEGRITAYAAVNAESPPEYCAGVWTDLSGKVAIVHRLSVLPSCQGSGRGHQMMMYIENYARCCNYTSIRLDAFLNNPAALNLYKNLGYQCTGTVEFRKGRFQLFEKVLSS